MVTLVLCGVMAVQASAATLTVLAAASLRESLTELAKDFEASHPGTRVRITFAGSQGLAASILLDAPADVFVSADSIQMNRVVTGGKASPKRIGRLCSNSLVVAVNRAAAAKVRSWDDIAKPGLRLSLAKPAVPAGEYADALIAKLPAAKANAIKANVVSRENDVRTVLARVSLGEADAGIVYVTDVLAGGNGIVSRSIPAKLQSPVLYEIAPLSGAREGILAGEFVTLALSKTGQGILKRHGFLPAGRR